MTPSGLFLLRVEKNENVNDNVTNLLAPGRLEKLRRIKKYSETLDSVENIVFLDDELLSLSLPVESYRRVNRFYNTRYYTVRSTSTRVRSKIDSFLLVRDTHTYMIQ